jgi:hypothetical protein
MATREGTLAIVSVTPTSTKGRFVTHSGYFAETGVPGTVITTYYKKRARDSGSVNPEYVIWVTTDIDGDYEDTPPFGGPLVDEAIISTWQD